MNDALLLALVNHGLIHGLDAVEAWPLAERLAAEGGDVRAMADQMREAAGDAHLATLGGLPS